MEDGSLLNEALKRTVGSATSSSLLVDVFLIEFHANFEQDDKNTTIPSSTSGNRRTCSTNHWLALAETCVQLNEYINKTRSYPWIQGGDGPVFGVHVSDGVPHLRAQCRYGPSVADEWKLVELVLEWSATSLTFEVAVQCIDVDDGQILLIQAAEHLPEWVDRIGAPNCEHRCWIQKGQVHLIEPASTPTSTTDDVSYLNLKQALRLLSRCDPKVKSVPKITECIQQRIYQAQHWHRAPMALPQPVAHLISRRPDLIPILAQSFVDHCHEALPKNEKYDLAAEHEWVWTTPSLGRTTYAMLRSVVAPPDWKTEFAIPPRYQSAQVKRIQRFVCQNQATPHLRPGVQLGVRLVAGMDFLLRSTDKTTNDTNWDTETRVMHLWATMERQCSGNDSQSWIQKAWQDGPNQSQFDLSNMIKSPVYKLEVEDSSTPLSRPETTIMDQIRTELARCANEGTVESTQPPSPEQVDNEDWMTLPADEAMEQMLGQSHLAGPDNPTSISSSKANQDFDSMLGGFQSFLQGQSTYEGVSLPNQDRSTAIHFNARVFMNLLHSTLKAQSGKEVQDLLDTARGSGGDEFFSAQDYDMDEGSQSDNSDEDDHADATTMEMMDAMDQELGQRETLGRNKNTLGINDLEDNQDEHDQVHLLSNLIQSLEASGGNPGPVQNIMAEMGKTTPLVLSKDIESSHDDNDDQES